MELRGEIIKIIHPQYGFPDNQKWECCTISEFQADSIISLINKRIEGIEKLPKDDSEDAKSGFDLALQKVKEVLK